MKLAAQNILWPNDSIQELKANCLNQEIIIVDAKNVKKTNPSAAQLKLMTKKQNIPQNFGRFILFCSMIYPTSNQS